MIHVFSAALGAMLCALGVMGIALEPAVTDAVQLRSSVVHNLLCIVTGIIALMGTVERGWITRKLCLATAAVHAPVVVVALIEAASPTPLFAFRASDLCASSLVVASCLAAVRRDRASARHLRAVYRNGNARYIPAKPELLAVED